MSEKKKLVNSNGVQIEFVYSTAETKAALEKLSKEALGAAARIVRKDMKRNMPIRTSHLLNHVGSWKRIARDTGRPMLDIGYLSWQKVRAKHKKPSNASPSWVEKGTRPHVVRVKHSESKHAKILSDKMTSFGKKVNHPGSKAHDVLRNAVYKNIDEIRAAEEKYLSKINDVLNIEDLHIPETPEEEDD